MTGFYDYLFYHIYKFYSLKEKGAAATSAMIVGGLQATNVLSIFMLISVFKSWKDNLTTITFIVVLCLFQILSYMRYILGEKITILKLEEKWQKKKEDQKVRFRIFMALYIALSIGVFFGIAIYLGSTSF